MMLVAMDSKKTEELVRALDVTIVASQLVKLLVMVVIVNLYYN